MFYSSKLAILLFISQLFITATAVAQSELPPDHSTSDDVPFEQWEKWFEEDFEEKAAQVNEGQLEFLATPPENQDSHSIANHITITPQSLKDQWISFKQCHTNLDPVAQSQVVYRYKQMRNLRIENSSNIDRAWVEDQSVQMEGLTRGARICILADAQIFRRINIDGKNAYAIRNGPYYRKFFDGYYPFNMTFSVKYPAAHLKLLTMSPEPQPGVTVKTSDGFIEINTWFEGELTIGMIFQAQSDK